MTDTKSEVKIGLDIDDTISSNPAYYSELCKKTYLEGGRVIIISSRSDLEEVRSTTTKQLRDWSIYYDQLYLFRPFEEVEHLCPHNELDWYGKYLWQKVYHCINENIDRYYDDEDKVIELFKLYAPEIDIIDAKCVSRESSQ